MTNEFFCNEVHVVDVNNNGKHDVLVCRYSPD